jgi:hypothetical protein
MKNETSRKRITAKWADINFAGLPIRSLPLAGLTHRVNRWDQGGDMNAVRETDSTESIASPSAEALGYFLSVRFGDGFLSVRFADGKQYFEVKPQLGSTARYRRRY